MISCGSDERLMQSLNKIEENKSRCQHLMMEWGHDSVATKEIIN